MYLYIMNENDFFEKYERDPIELSNAKEGIRYGMITYKDVTAENNGSDLIDHNKSLSVKDGNNNITELFPNSASYTESADGQTLHNLKAVLGGSRKRTKGGRRLMSARKQKSKTAKRATRSTRKFTRR
jgi:hypothetical protein